MQRLVNGELVDLTPEEEEAHLARTPPSPRLRRFTPRQVLLGFYALVGDEQTHGALDQMGRRQREEFYTATLIDEDDPNLIQWLGHFNKTIEEFKTALDGLSRG